MKRLFVTTAIAGAMFFSVESATAQEAPTVETATEQQTQQKDDFKQIQEQELSAEVRQSIERDYQGATVNEAYVKEKDGETKYKIVLQTQDGQTQEVYTDAEGNWIEKDKK